LTPFPLKSITEFYAKEPSADIPKIASGFCMGIGKTGGDICGTVAGGVIALGLLFGRMNGEEDNRQVIELASEYRKLFLSRYCTTNCHELLKEFVLCSVRLARQ
jgi:C_GCAxxG_C_C family probable redox protein